MYLEGDKWKNWHTRCSDAAIKENKSEEDTKLSTISVSKLAGERLTRLVKYVLDTDEPLSHLDYREFEPNWIQFKFQEEEFNLELLDKLARANDNIVNEAILRQCFKFRKEKFDLELLDNLTRENDGTVNENILRQCMINDSKKETDL